MSDDLDDFGMAMYQPDGQCSPVLLPRCDEQGPWEPTEAKATCMFCTSLCWVRPATLAALKAGELSPICLTCMRMPPD